MLVLMSLHPFTMVTSFPNVLETDIDFLSRLSDESEIKQDFNEWD